MTQAELDLLLDFALELVIVLPEFETASTAVIDCAAEISIAKYKVLCDQCGGNDSRE